MNKKKWIIGTCLVAAVIGGSLLTIAKQYKPLLFVVGDQVVRTDDWDQLKAKLFYGVNYTQPEEVEKLDQRSKEELVLAKAREAGITVDEANVEKQLKQLGETPEERAPKLKEMNMTEEDVRENYRRALMAFQLKAQVTKSITVSEPEIADYYEQNKLLFKAPEFRTLHFLQANKSDTNFVSLVQTATPEAFKKTVEQYTTPDANGRVGAFHEMIGADHLLSHTNSEKASVSAFQAPQGKVFGPIVDGDRNFWFLVDEIKPEHQFTLQEVHAKVQTTLLQDKQLKYYRQWLDGQKESVGYYYAPDNLTRGKFEAFYEDLSENMHLLLNGKW